MAHNIFNAYQRDTGHDVFCVENQRIMADLWANHVYANITNLIEHLNENTETLSMEDQEKLKRLIGSPNYYRAAEDEVKEVIEKYFGVHLMDADIDHLTERITDTMNKEFQLVDFCEDRQLDLEEYTEDILAHFAVSEWLAQRLETEGEAVEEIFNMQVWGRKTTGQDVKMDSVIARIAIKGGLLVGQKQNDKQALAA